MQTTGLFYYPFSELEIGSLFVFHPNHLADDKKSPTFRKTSEHQYVNESSPKTNFSQKYRIVGNLIHSTQIAKVSQ